MISAVVLTHNETKTLEKTLASLSWCDERILIDDNSTEPVELLAKKYQCQIVRHALDDDFAQARNTGLSKTKGDWILFVDSDEIVTKTLADEIQQVTKTTDYQGFGIRRLDTMWGKTLYHGEVGNTWLVRLAQKSAGVWKRPVHEVWEISGKVGRLTQPLLHYPHPTVADFLSDINRYSTRNAQYLYDKKVPVAGWQIVAYPVGKFIRNYVVKAGFLDDMPGFIVAMMMSFHSFLTRGKLYLLYDKHRQDR